jgi:hypothetical protein
MPRAVLGLLDELLDRTSEKEWERHRRSSGTDGLAMTSLHSGCFLYWART